MMFVYYLLLHDIANYYSMTMIDLLYITVVYTYIYFMTLVYL